MHWASTPKDQANMNLNLRTSLVLILVSSAVVCTVACQPSESAPEDTAVAANALKLPKTLIDQIVLQPETSLNSGGFGLSCTVTADGGGMQCKGMKGNAPLSKDLNTTIAAHIDLKLLQESPNKTITLSAQFDPDTKSYTKARLTREGMEPITVTITP